jgi:hypothetical protein
LKPVPQPNVKHDGNDRCHNDCKQHSECRSQLPVTALCMNDRLMS